VKAAVLLIVWRRPHTTRQVIDAIRQYAPERLYVACDGPSAERPGEEEKVAATRALIERSVDWPCQLHRLFCHTNQGCNLGPTRAISWFFENESEGIILEDDCIPHDDFFLFCESLLDRYRNDERVWCISGINLQDGHWRGDGSYYFSRYSHCWGWASWSNRWRYFDGELKQWPSIVMNNSLAFLFTDPIERVYWSNIWWRTYLQSEACTWWDYQWFFTCLVNSGLTALPNRNLVSNIGFGVDATHTTDARVSHVASESLGTLAHPTFPIADSVADKYTFEHHIAGKNLRYKASFRGRFIDPTLAKLQTALQRPFHYPAKLLHAISSVGQ
jgi:hypothetical protein